MGQDQAAQVRHFEAVAGGFGLHVRQAEQHQRRWLTGFVVPVALDGGDFRRLVLQGVQAMGIADRDLHGRGHQDHPHGHR
ncbi:hypothetical protein D3C80_1105740 [compost metagenome]